MTHSTALDLLFIGGTGVISSAAAAHASSLGHRVTVLNRGVSTKRPVPAGVEVLSADVRDPAAVRTALGGRTFDAVADFLSFTAEHVAAAVELYRGRTGQYVFISSASAYQKPPARLPVLESTPLRNPFWQYSRDKIAGEEILVQAYRNEGFPGTVVRPSHTYDATMVPLSGHWTDIHRMRAGLPVVVPGDGTSLWTLTHSRDFAKAFVGLLGRPAAIGESYTITSDEFLPWDAIYRSLAAAAGVPEPLLVHVASETIAQQDPGRGPGLLGDKSHSVIFDNSKIKSLVPGYRAVIPFAEGAREIVQWHDAHPQERTLDTGWMDLSDRMARWVRAGA
ncbi:MULTISPECIES: NAD-dependent epimerase/dehydratase family protein [unclassified Arthrobacter]|uniref:NAD-dependent epimerase/dehydratase family protein n=1 Tax=unclassified Arthrobacter TaxID=235627 RepID=UPI001E37BB90|nr:MULTISPECIES: NAD-dependent epimerase/dehydratase family protein [unclassified Arthrobacter]MCC9145602.1 NAD-dependent epimerase/dehydratase family protein [Arthrobacter sp. zg-Y919]MDK1276831.1 NAD-dependent epimerase/dehydratase family protein [Arthrobacter sp. zg.Y919]WIB04231.1 NAD-dependent epimerase/dehydratase family protein [Arthrobacter sp. zg-Y919]